MIYLDNAATTPVTDEVLNEMLPYFKEQYGNPSSLHLMGRVAKKAITKAKCQVAEAINADPDNGDMHDRESDCTKFHAEFRAENAEKILKKDSKNKRKCIKF